MSPRTYRPCQHCRTVRLIRSRGLCWPCYETPEISRLYPPPSIEPTEEELDAMIAEQMKCRPAWWDRETRAVRREEAKAVRAAK